MDKSLVHSIIFAVFFFVMIIDSAFADLFYTPTEYNYLYSEKVALEIELKTLKIQFRNEKEKLLGTIKEFELQIDDLKRSISEAERKNAEENAVYEKRLDENRKLIEILKGNKNALEKKLIEENRTLQAKCDDAISKLSAESDDRLKQLQDEIKSIKDGYEKIIADLKSEISNISDELADMKKLNEQQRIELSRLEKQGDELEKQLSEEIKKGEIRLKRFHDRLIINLDDKICFDSGHAELKKNVLASLEKISRILQQYPEYNIVVEGHTDNIPISTVKFRNNWQLSTERALVVLDYLLREKELSPERFTASGYGEYKPLLPNDTKENRALNRRVDIVVIPMFKQKPDK